MMKFWLKVRPKPCNTNSRSCSTMSSEKGLEGSAIPALLPARQISLGLVPFPVCHRVGGYRMALTLITLLCLQHNPNVTVWQLLRMASLGLHPGVASPYIAWTRWLSCTTDENPIPPFLLLPSWLPESHGQCYQSQLFAWLGAWLPWITFAEASICCISVWLLGLIFFWGQR